jgi:hypothetical protein
VSAVVEHVDRLANHAGGSDAFRIDPLQLGFDELDFRVRPKRRRVEHRLALKISNMHASEGIRLLR